MGSRRSRSRAVASDAVGVRRTTVLRSMAIVAMAASVGVLAGCGDGTGDADANQVPLSAQAERGRSIAQGNGCASCHGSSFGGGVAPTWIGLAGSNVTLTDGTTVVADRDYLTRAITAPADERVQGYSIVMPQNLLTADEVADVVAYIEALGTPASDG
jgi:cytochrome c1